MNRDLVKKRNEQIVELLKQNFTPREIVTLLKNKYFITTEIVEKIKSSNKYRCICEKEEREIRNKKIIELWLKGYLYKEIAYEVNTTYWIVGEIVHKYKTDNPNVVRKRKYSQDTYNYMNNRNNNIYSDYKKGMNIKSISKKYFLSYNRTSTIIREMKQKVRVDE